MCISLSTKIFGKIICYYRAFVVSLFGAPSTLQILPKRLLLVPSTSFQCLSMASLPQPLSISTLTSAQKKSSSVVALLLSTDDSHRDDVLRAANSMLSDCLSETHLDQTVPGLISKTRGKVQSIWYISHFCLYNGLSFILIEVV